MLLVVLLLPAPQGVQLLVYTRVHDLLYGDEPHLRRLHQNAQDLRPLHQNSPTQLEKEENTHNGLQGEATRTVV